MGSLEQVQSCHTEAHTLMFGTQKNLTGQVRLEQLLLMTTLKSDVTLYDVMLLMMALGQELESRHNMACHDDVTAWSSLLIKHHVQNLDSNMI